MSDAKWYRIHYAEFTGRGRAAPCILVIGNRVAVGPRLEMVGRPWAEVRGELESFPGEVISELLDPGDA